MGNKRYETFIKETFKKDLSLSGIRLWLKRNDFTFKKPKIVPANTDPIAQQKFIEHYEKIMNEAAALEEPVLFGDSVHPCQETRVSYGWVKKGKDKEIPSTAGRKRINIMGALNLETMNFVYKEFETSIKSENAVEFLQKLEAAYPGKGRIHLIWDQAGYHKGNDVLEYLKTSRIKVHYLPPRSPNLNAIERLWKIMHEFACNNISFAKFSDFCTSIRNFFDNTMHNIHDVLISRITDHFRIGFVGK